MADHSAKVKDIIEKELGVEREKLTAEASFIEDLGADSLDIVELVMEFEKEFNIDIPDEDAEKLRPSAMRSNTWTPKSAPDEASRRCDRNRVLRPSATTSRRRGPRSSTAGREPRRSRNLTRPRGPCGSLPRAEGFDPLGCMDRKEAKRVRTPTPSTPWPRPSRR